MTLAEVLQQVRLLDIRTRRLVTASFAGEYASVFRGRGVEFADVREYQPGDDVRTIDWCVTARTGSAHVRQYVEERQLVVVFVVDASGSEAFGSRVRTKIDLAAGVCALLATAAVRSNDRVGLLLFTDRVERFVPPGSGRRHVLRLLRDLLSFEPGRRGTDLAGALEFACRVLPRQALLVVVSDFLADGYEQALAAAGRRHDAIAVQLRDRRERRLPDAGLVVLREAESGRWRLVDTGSRAVRESYRRRAEELDRSLEALLRRHGVDLIRLETGRDYVEPVLAFFRRRGLTARRRAAAGRSG